MTLDPVGDNDRILCCLMRMLQMQCETMLWKGEAMDSCKDLDVTQMQPRRARKEQQEERDHPFICSSHVPDLIIRVPQNVKVFRAPVDHDVDDVNTSRLQQTCNQPRLFYMVV